MSVCRTKALDSAELATLRAAVGRVVTYQHVGVARINEETRNELVETIKQN